MDRDLKLPWLLVATPQLMDPNFRRAVVLVVEHNVQGTMGFVLNRPLRTPVAELVVDAGIEVPRSVPAWYGGPVATAAGVIVHRKGLNLKSSDEVLTREHFAVTADDKSLLDLAGAARRRLAQLDALESEHGRGAGLADSVCLYPYRFVVGYAGWGRGQLDAELRAGAWLQVPATDRLAFGTPWSRLWDAVLGTVGASAHALVAPSHQYLN